MEKISVAIITLNEESNITECLNSLNWANEIVVVDSGSNDSTIQICHDFGCKIHTIKWQGFSHAKQTAVDFCTNDWVLSLDADERVTVELSEKIKSISEHPKYNGYRIFRLSYYLNKPIIHSGWNRDNPLRLFNKKKGSYNHKLVHESFQLEGKTGIIYEKLLHFTFPTFFSHIEKINRYSDLAAEMALKEGRRSSPLKAIFKSAFKFFSMYVFQFGFLDGVIGFLLAKNSAFGVYLREIKIWSKGRKSA